MRFVWVAVLTLGAFALGLARAEASCSITDLSPYNDISDIYVYDWVTEWKIEEDAPPLTRPQAIVIHANGMHVGLGGPGVGVGENVYATKDPPGVVFDRLVNVLRLHNFYSMAAPSESPGFNAAILPYVITVERCGRKTTLSASILSTEQNKSKATNRFLELLDDLLKTTLQSKWTRIYSL